MPKYAPMPRLCHTCARSVRTLVAHTGETVLKHCPEHRVLAIARVRNKVIASWDIFGPLSDAELDATLARIQASIAAHLAGQAKPAGEPAH